MEAFVDGRPKRWRTRFLYALARLQEDSFLVAVEWFFFAGVVVVGLQEAGLYQFEGTAVLVVILLIVGQLELGSIVALRPGYPVDLAYRASGLREKSRPSMLTWRLHMKAMKRIAEEISGGHLNELLLMALPDALWNTSESKDPKGQENRPSGFDEIRRAIEIGLTEEAGQLHGTGRKVPFRVYARALEEGLLAKPFTFEAWRAFVISRYSGLSPRCRAVAKLSPHRSVLDKIEMLLDRYKMTIGIAIALLTLLVTLVTLLR